MHPDPDLITTYYNFAPSSSARYYGPRGCDGAVGMCVRVGPPRVMEGGVRIRVGLRVGLGEARVRVVGMRVGRIGVVEEGNGVPDAPSGLSSGVHCLNVTTLD